MLWSGRFSKASDEDMLMFTRSLEWDVLLYAHDIAGSIAHVQSLEKIGVVSKKDTATIVDALKSIRKEFEKQTFVFKPEDEDIHMAIERRLTELTGSIGKQLHTGRSRNDQVSLAMRMFLKDECVFLNEDIRDLMLALCTCAEKNIDVVMPGYTHMQQAQPVLFAHYLLAYTHMFRRDHDRYCRAFDTCDVMPLGSGALAGTPYPIDRGNVAKALHFSAITANSMDAVSDRDFILDFLYASSVFAMHCSRLAEDLIIFSSQEFGFIELDDAYTTGSSLMPQKKNPDVLELIRGRSERVISGLNGFMNVMKGLPLTYNRDMQEDKFYLFTARNVVNDMATLLPSVVSTMRVNKERMRAALDHGYVYATVVADYLVKKNIPFREAHHITGELVGYALRHKKSFSALTLDEYKKFSAVFSDDIYTVFNAKKIIDAQCIDGGTSTKSVKKQIKDIHVYCKEWTTHE